MVPLNFFNLGANVILEEFDHKAPIIGTLALFSLKVPLPPLIHLDQTLIEVFGLLIFVHIGLEEVRAAALVLVGHPFSTLEVLPRL